MEIEDKIQWHPAFCSAITLEFRENKHILEFIREYNLNNMPLQIDLLVIKKKLNENIKNEIGDFFLGYNIFEFKSPDDAVNIDTFYKVLACACLYKADTGNVDAILDTEITISLVLEGKPVNLLKQLDQKYTVAKKGAGIYRIDNMLFPMQIIVTKELSSGSHIWLKSLTRSMRHAEAEKLLDSYTSLKDSEDRFHADAIVNLASDANHSLFEQIAKEGDPMSEALKELIEPELAKLKVVIANHETKLADTQAELADTQAELADTQAELADKIAEISFLKKKLAEIKNTATT